MLFVAVSQCRLLFNGSPVLENCANEYANEGGWYCKNQHGSPQMARNAYQFKAYHRYTPEHRYAPQPLGKGKRSLHLELHSHNSIRQLAIHRLNYTN
jgi:hypothetical protein